MPRDNRTPEQIREHYRIETRLAEKLRTAEREQRRQLYSEVYDTFFKSIEHLPQIKVSEEEREKQIDYLLREVKPYLNPDMLFLELGAGDCKLALRVAESVEKVLVIEASDEVIQDIETPPNFELMIADSTAIPLEDNSIDVVFSNQVMEHLHPEDAQEQLINIYRVLKPGGIYLCMTPNRISGPHDISKYFDEDPKGLHLKEYTGYELVMLFKSTGFASARIFARYRRFRLFIPAVLMAMIESFFLSLPFLWRKRLCRNAFIMKFFGINIIGRK
jgi:ubiquinone/menaquinone biosynthesis C-methylase UbiE